MEKVYEIKNVNHHQYYLLKLTEFYTNNIEFVWVSILENYKC